MKFPSVDVQPIVVEYPGIHLPEDFVEQHGFASQVLTIESATYLAQMAFDLFRPELIGMGMDYHMEDKIAQIFSELERVVNSAFKDLFKYKIKYYRGDPWKGEQSCVSWNILIKDKLVVSFKSGNGRD